LLYDQVLPFYEAMGVPDGAILPDNGCEFCGRPEVNPYELLTAIEGIEHRTTKIRSPRTNGFVERRNQTLLDECFRVSGSTTWFESMRSHQGYRLQGRTSAMAFRDAQENEKKRLSFTVSPAEKEAFQDEVV
jgi:transposase InsO family protein